MPHKDIEARKAWWKDYYIRTRERRLAAARESRNRGYRLRSPELQPGYKGGRWDAGNGYIRVPDPERPSRWLYEHRVVAAEKIGRALTREEHVHHINGNKHDNRPENLEVWPNKAHKAVHQRRLQGRLEMVSSAACLCGCGQLVPEFDKRGRPRKGYVSGHNRKPE